jgi:tRNA-specific 2-thiouridylase
VTRKTVAVAMSGGIDSSVAAALLSEKGYNVFGIIMKLWDGREVSEAPNSRSCYGPDETSHIELANRVALKLGIRLHVIDCSEEFRKEVLEYVRHEYQSGRTPNPCVVCNRKIKFDVLMQKAEKSGLAFDYFATGHYCRVEYTKEADRYLLKKGSDPLKDQSYFLSSLSQEQLGKTLFPIGTYTKNKVREIHHEHGIDAFERPESRDFVSEGYRSIIGESRPGRIIDSRGNLLGEHAGIADFTVGQRKGLGISSPVPLYVLGIHPDTGDITVGEKEELLTTECAVSKLNWIAVKQLEEPMVVDVKIRSTHPGAQALVTPTGETMVKVAFYEPQMAVTPGQTAVFYYGDTVIGSGTIDF